MLMASVACSGSNGNEAMVRMAQEAAKSNARILPRRTKATATAAATACTASSKWAAGATNNSGSPVRLGR